MAKQKFQWDASALIPDTVEIDFSSLTDNAETPDLVTFTELSRTDLVIFVEESLELNVIKLKTDGTPETDEDGKQVRKKFAEVEKEHAAFLFKWLEKACQSKKKAKDFETMKLTVPAIAALVDMLLKLNHVDEVLATSGNWLMLPQAMAFLAAANAGSSESENPNQTSPA